MVTGKYIRYRAVKNINGETKNETDDPMYRPTLATL